jgi:hypothetical protein
MSTIIETSNGWWFASATVTCPPTASAPTPRRARPARLASCPASRPTDAEREGRARPSRPRRRAGGWPSKTSRQRRVGRADVRMWRKCDRAPRPGQGSSMTGERSHGKAPSRPNLPTEPGRAPLYPLRAPCPRISCCTYTTLESVEYQRHDAKSDAWPTVTTRQPDDVNFGIGTQTS